MTESKRKIIHWQIATVVICGFMAFYIIRTSLHAFNTWLQIYALQQERDSYQERINSDSTLLEQLKYDELLERFAREKYFMQRRNEEVYIIEEVDKE